MQAGDGREFYRPTWVDIDVDALEHNARAIVDLAGQKGMVVMAVVKADGYGHGLLAAARASIAGGARMLGVASIDEAVALREGGLTAPILVLTAPVPGTGNVYASRRVTATVTSVNDARRLHEEAQGQPIVAHVKLDTGMTRLGVYPEDAMALIRFVRDLPGFHIQGVFSHLATADEEDTSFAQVQIDRFRRVLSELKRAGIAVTYTHLLNTPGLLAFDAPGTNMARIGLGLYGLYPMPWVKHVVSLTPVMTWRTRVASVRRIPAGVGVSYGHADKTERETTLVTLPVGYADGLRRNGNASRRAHVLVHGRPMPVVGRICMDQTIVDVGDYPVQVGDEVVMIGRQGDATIDVEYWAELAETVNYEIVTTVGRRVPRVYTGRGSNNDH